MTPFRLELDYLAAPRRRRWIGLALLAAALAVAGHLVVRYLDIQQERTVLAARLELLDAGRRLTRPVHAGRPEEESKEVESVLRQLTLPWPQMIESVESTASKQVVLLQMQPEPERRLLRLTAEAGTPEAMFDYVRRLGESKALSGVHLVSHQVERDRPSRPIQFVAQASLRNTR